MAFSIEISVKNDPWVILTPQTDRQLHDRYPTVIRPLHDRYSTVTSVTVLKIFFPIELDLGYRLIYRFAILLILGFASF